MEYDSKRIIRRTSNVNSLMIIIFYILDYTLIKMGGRIVYSLAEDSKYLYDIAELVSYCIQYLIVVPLVIYIFKLISGNKEGMKISAGFRKPSMPTSWIARWIIIAVGLSYAANYISTFLFSAIQSSIETEFKGVDLVSSGTSLGAFTSVLAMTVLAPFFEELMFRGTLFRNTEKCGQWTGVIMIGLTFGLWHGSYQQILYAAVMGACACLMFAKTGSIIPGLILHVFINSIGAIQSVCLGQLDLNALNKALETEDLTYMTEHMGVITVIVSFSLLTFALMIAGIVLFCREIKFHKDSFSLINFCPDIPQKKKLWIYLTSPVTIIAFAGLIAMTVMTAIGVI